MRQKKTSKQFTYSCIYTNPHAHRLANIPVYIQMYTGTHKYIYIYIYI